MINKILGSDSSGFSVSYPEGENSNIAGLGVGENIVDSFSGRVDLFYTFVLLAMLY